MIRLAKRMDNVRKEKLEVAFTATSLIDPFCRIFVDGVYANKCLKLRFKMLSRFCFSILNVIMIASCFVVISVHLGNRNDVSSVVCFFSN